MNELLKLTRHNGRFGKNGVYNPRHNDRRFDAKNSDHIDPERLPKNLYWDYINGLRSPQQQNDPDDVSESFGEVEQLFYEQRYKGFIEGQNARNEKNRHPERNRTALDLLNNKKTCPEETVFQIGTMEKHVSPDVLLAVVTDFMEEFDRRFGEHIHTLDWALHLDESTPHIQERHVFDCENEYGEIAPQQEKALEALGFELPDPEKPMGRRNNRKMVFDSACRAMLFDITKQHGLQLDEEPEYGGRKYLEKQDYILMKQKERLVEQAEQIAKADKQLETLTMKIEDVETLIDEVTDIAYDKAVETVTEVVREETHKEDIAAIEQKKKWLLSPERKASKEKREYAASQMDGIISQIKKLMQTAVSRVHDILMKPEVKQAATAQIKTEARESVLKKLHDCVAQSKQVHPRRREDIHESL